jgi:hypothetical protein
LIEREFIVDTENSVDKRSLLDTAVVDRYPGSLSA